MDKVKQIRGNVTESSEAFIKRLSDESEADYDYYEFSDVDIEGPYDP